MLAPLRNKKNLFSFPNFEVEEQTKPNMLELHPLWCNNPKNLIDEHLTVLLYWEKKKKKLMQLNLNILQQHL